MSEKYPTQTEIERKSLIKDVHNFTVMHYVLILTSILTSTFGFTVIDKLKPLNIDSVKLPETSLKIERFWQSAMFITSIVSGVSSLFVAFAANRAAKKLETLKPNQVLLPESQEDDKNTVFDVISPAKGRYVTQLEVSRSNSNQYIKI